MRTRTWAWLAGVGFRVCSGASIAGSARTLPRLPGELKLERSDDSPGQVTFYHETHVNGSKPACTPCHPREFRILRANARTQRILHERFDEGRQCGSCHDGKRAFNVEDDCSNCHRD